MNNYELTHLPDIIFGRKMEEKCGELMKELGCTKVLVHHSGEPFVLPLIEKIKGWLNEAGLECLDLGGVVPNPHLSKVYEGIDLCRKEGVDGILAVGGGSVIDSSKAIAAGVPYEGDIWELYGVENHLTYRLPLGVVSTFAGTGSEMSPASVITNEKTHMKLGLDDNQVMRVDFCILDPELTFTMPRLQTAAGASDIMSHLMENFFTATPEVYFNQQMLIGCMHTVIDHAPIAVREPDNYASRSALMISAAMACSWIMKTGHVGDWGTHAMEHEMSTEWNIPHGLGLAILTPVWMRYVYKRNVTQFAKFATEVFRIQYDYVNPENTALAGIQALSDWFVSLGMPRTIREFVKGDTSDATLWKMARRINYACPGGTNGMTYGLKPQDVMNIYKLAL